MEDDQNKRGDLNLPIVGRVKGVDHCHNQPDNSDADRPGDMSTTVASDEDAYDE